jgi:hypothetical protein
MRKILPKMSNFWTDSPRNLRLQVVSLAVLSSCLLAFCVAPGCSITPSSPQREKKTYSIIAHFLAAFKDGRGFRPRPARIPSLDYGETTR